MIQTFSVKTKNAVNLAKGEKMFGNNLEKVLDHIFSSNDEQFMGEVKILRRGFRFPDGSCSCCVYNYAAYND